MREREVELSGSIANLLDRNIIIKCGKDGVTSTFPPEPELRLGGYTHFNGKFDPVGELYGRLNGCFKLYFPQKPISDEEIKLAKDDPCIDPRLGEDNRKYYCIVSRKVAVTAIVEYWHSLDHLLIPARAATGCGKNVCQGFIPVSLLARI